MKKLIANLFPSLTLFSLLMIYACTKESGTVSNSPLPMPGSNSVLGHHTARYSGSDYSQSIPVDSANALIGSYLTSVHYPNVDTALRSLTFDADTLRAYLMNSNIVTLKFMIAHRPSYKASNNGNYAGMNPGALTVVIVGQDEADNYVLNDRGQVYDHTQPCPSHCSGGSNAFIY
jgi:hypothetical protein